MGIVRVIMVGDVSGDPGLQILERRLPALIKEHSADFTVVNGENSADGFGMTGETLNRILAAGADAVTSGNHVWEKRDFWPVLENDRRILRPANYPGGTPGRGWARFEKNALGKTISFFVINLQGREFMSSIDCPFKTFDSFEAGLGDLAANTHPILDHEGMLPDAVQEKFLILVDFHAESSREKEALAYYLNGRAALVAGTHTHVQTADERILSQGSAYITDLGMTGITGGVIGMDTKICIDRVTKQVLYRMETATGGEISESAIQGVLVEIETETGKAVSIKRINDRKTGW